MWSTPRTYPLTPSLESQEEFASINVMLAASSVPTSTTGVQQQHTGDADPFILYARSLHDYTLRLWTESRRTAEEKTRLKAAATASGSPPPPAAPHGQKRTDNGTLKV
ncbi:hypothetical protein BD309DRAFT_1014359 [Dichomitus squalens]|nr:hypothetical protein BD309DRAFT_1014359 [Dichomitus squalens]